MPKYAAKLEDGTTYQVPYINRDLRKVESVIVVPDVPDVADFCVNTLGMPGDWIETSIDNTFRKKYTSSGDFYDPLRDRFFEEQPYLSWILNSDGDWEPPVPYPDDGYAYYWEEYILDWVLIPS